MTTARNTTETTRRLRRSGIILDIHMRQVVHILLCELGIEDYSVVENLIYETLRWINGGTSEIYPGVYTIAVD